jgi:hypothetical protein
MLKDPRFVAKMIAALQAENGCLREIERLKQELATLQSEIQCKKRERLAEELRALQAENRCLKEIERREAELSVLQLETCRLNELNGRLPTVDETASESIQEVVPAVEEPRRIEERGGTCAALTEEQIESIRCDDDVFDAAMKFVHGGEATLIAFSEDRITAKCGRIKHPIQRIDADGAGGWLAVFRTIIETPEHYCTCPVLYFDSTCVILAESFGNEGMESLLQCVEVSAERIRDRNDEDPLIDPEHYDSYGLDR